MDYSFLIAIGFGCLGAMLGSFSSLLIWRLHHEEGGILWGRSRCPKCKNTLCAHNLVPIFSWIVQAGKCAKCKTDIPAFYPLIELFFAGTFFIFAQKFWGTTEFPWIMIFVFLINVLFFYDAQFYEVDRRISFPAIALALTFAYFRDADMTDFLIGGAVGYLFYAVQYYGSKGKWVGFGDLELGTLMGLLLGWKMLLLALFVAYIIGSMYVIPLLIMKKATGKTQLPMGAFLMPATLLALLEGEVILNWYLGVLGV